MSGAGAMGFRWLEVLEKEFDKSFVDLDLLLRDIDEEQSDIALEGRDRMTRSEVTIHGSDVSSRLSRQRGGNAVIFLRHVIFKLLSLLRLSAAFAQLCHKSESIFHQNSHLETQLVAMRSELCQLRSLKTVLERQINDLVYQVS